LAPVPANGVVSTEPAAGLRKACAAAAFLTADGDEDQRGYNQESSGDIGEKPGMVGEIAKVFART
jgi:hypothetical protein